MLKQHVTSFISDHSNAQQTSQYVIELLQNYIMSLGYTPHIHFELEGTFQLPTENAKNKKHSHKPFQLNFEKINFELQQYNIDGKLVPEYWQNQWEFVSDFNGQSPLKEAQNLAALYTLLPKLFAKQGVLKTLIKPVVWSGDKGRIATQGKNIFSQDSRPVHIPNAIQLNISAVNQQGENMITKANFGEYLQSCFLQTSYACCLLYLPEEEAFERLKLTSQYGLANELCSPNDISGGHQGSIALYKKVGKHNQLLGQDPLLYNSKQEVVLSRDNWQKTARIEHRLGASSLAYDPYVNVIFALINLIQALEQYIQIPFNSVLPIQTEIKNTQLPSSLYGKNGAITLFEQDNWFAESINRVMATIEKNQQVTSPLSGLGNVIKNQMLAKYQPNALVLS